MARAVRCPGCGGWSRVADGAAGATVACPHCARPFTARPAPPPEPADVPVVRRRSKPPGEVTEGPATHLIGLALVPLAIPFVWLLLPLVGGVRPIFTFALPTAIAAGVGGLCLGVAYAANWTHGTRLKAILMLLALGYGSAAFLYFVKKEWAEAVRKRVGPADFKWREFSPPDGAYKALVPGRPASADESPLPGWPLAAYRLAAGPPNDPVLSVAYELAHGPPAEAVRPRRTPDAEWFAAARAALVERTGGVVTAETPVSQQSYAARDYAVTLPDGATTRLVRVVRGERRAFYLAVEGAFIAGDHRFVQKFFDKFLVTPGR